MTVVRNLLSVVEIFFVEINWFRIDRATIFPKKLLFLKGRG